MQSAAENKARYRARAMFFLVLGGGGRGAKLCSTSGFLYIFPPNVALAQRLLNSQSWLGQSK